MGKTEHSRAELYRSERAKGKTYQEIAEMYGVTHQRVAQVCCRQKDSQFRPFTKERCIYVNLRNYLNENRISLSELIRRCNNTPNGMTLGRYGQYLRGESYPNKQTIDKILAATGLTYEQLWEVDDG